MVILDNVVNIGHRHWNGLYGLHGQIVQLNAVLVCINVFVIVRYLIVVLDHMYKSVNVRVTYYFVKMKRLMN